MTTKKKTTTARGPIPAKGSKDCALCHGFGLVADLWGAGYRWAVRREQALHDTARVNCDRCGCGGTPNGERVAETSRQRLAGAKEKAAR